MFLIDDAFFLTIIGAGVVSVWH